MQLWGEEALARPRMGLAATAVSDVVFFAGGGDLYRDFADVDVYDAKEGHWMNPLSLSQP